MDCSWSARLHRHPASGGKNGLRHTVSCQFLDTLTQDGLRHFVELLVRKYDAAYIKYDFVAVEKSAIELSQCVVCLDTLSSDALWLTRRDCSSICITA
ncbi:hypothetical protein T4B_7649 [Trichinella pseudospiralis]|uniref:Uncharacterized protein n=1 Tax=Trichinella pseudospiralis TaxID=6337 RepID=A0A0V1ITK3_TRIPS|nr:hypothetical protein T4B_7649 [Trichinella pseudospiralis]KRZ36339.1 hypothetical protein T4C_4301 [Trichinella pseudospiralis]